MNFIKNFFVEMLKASPLMHWPCAAADDKKAPPARIFTGPASGLINRGQVGTNSFKNILATVALPFADSISGKITFDVIYSRTSPVGDTDYASSPIGSFCVTETVASAVVINSRLFLKVGALASQWVEIGGQGAVNVSDVTLTSAQVKALKATPIELVAAPGVNLAIVPVAINIVCNYGGTNVFTETADDFSIEYVGSSTEIKEIEGTGLIDQAVDEWRYITFEHAETFIPVENEAVGITNLDDEFAGNAGGDNTVAIKLYYRIVPTDA